MTEQEATSKWCPMVRVVIGPSNATWQDHAVTNRGDIIRSGGTEVMCIASNCMMWRWSSVTCEYGKEGYCGLGGKS